MAIPVPDTGHIFNTLENPNGSNVSGTVEIKRNLFKLSKNSEVAFTSYPAIVTSTPDGEGRIYELIDDVLNGASNMVFWTPFDGQASVEPGEVYSLRIGLENVGSAPYPVYLYTKMYGNDYPNDERYNVFTLFPNEYREITVESYEAGPNATGLGIQLRYSSNSTNPQIGSKIKVHDGIVLTKTETAVGMFNGDAQPDDGDLTPEWIGTVGKSESIITAPKPVGWGDDVYYSPTNESLARIDEEVVLTPQGDGLKVLVLRNALGTGTQRINVDTDDPVVFTTPYKYFKAGLMDEGYEGRYFDGDLEPFNFRNQTVEPHWTGDVNNSSSSFEYLIAIDGIITTKWHEPTQKAFSLGVDRGMLYLETTSVPWSGLVSVSPNSGEGESTKRYLDGRIYDIRVQPQDFSAEIEAYTYPVELDEYLGNASVDGTGLVAHGQFVKTFDMVYRTMIGSEASLSDEYKIHILYGCIAEETGITANTINDQPEAELFQFSVEAIPVDIQGYRPTSYFTIDSRMVNHVMLGALESVLYGLDGVAPSLPSIDEIRSFLSI